MSHARKQIRDAVVSILSVNPVAWKTVLNQRVVPDRVLWPYMLVFVESETSSGTITDPSLYGRDLVIAIRGMLRLPGTGNKESIEDRMDEVAEEIETKLTQRALREKVSVGSVEMLSSSMTVIEGEGDDGKLTDYAEVALSFRIGYSTLEGYPGSLL